MRPIREVLRTLGYRTGSAAILVLLRAKRFSASLGWLAKVFLRHQRVHRHLSTASYDRVVDGGANIGEFAALVRAARPDVRLICVEPLPREAEILRRRGFEVVEAALWSAEGKATLRQPLADSTSASLVAEAPTGSPEWVVRTVRLEGILEGSQRAFVKLDLQGGELEALRGIGEKWTSIAAILIEVGYGRSGSNEAIRSSLRAHGFFEAATFNELDVDGYAVEGDRLWLRQRD